MKNKKTSKAHAVGIIFFLIAVCVTGSLLFLVWINGTINGVGRISSITKRANAAGNGATEGRTSGKTGGASNAAMTADTISWDDLDDIEVIHDADILNLLLIGEDRRKGEEGRARSDSMILCSIDLKNAKITLTSLMRDMYVDIPGYGADKLNAAYMEGGHELLDSTITRNLGIQIDGNVIVDFNGFLEGLATVGNIPITLNKEEADYLNTYPGLGSDDDEAHGEGWCLVEGENNLTPSQALAYARIRYIGNSDWERTERQRAVVMSAFRTLQGSGPAKIMSVAKKLIPCVKTDLSSTEMLSLVKTIAVNNISDLQSQRVPVDNSYTPDYTEGGAAVLRFNAQWNSAALHHFIYGTDYDETMYSAPEALNPGGAGDELNGGEGITSTSGYGTYGTDNSGTEYGGGTDYSGGTGYSGGTDYSGGAGTDGDTGYSGGTDYSGGAGTDGGTDSGGTED
uniref:LCP family protein n=1 Tax=Eubacterium cellulosolvens TaxID=29322 RepID=UPI000484A974|nr:LCP family protein [[Eubacterium] cellulosolvens]